MANARKWWRGSTPFFAAHKSRESRGGNTHVFLPFNSIWMFFFTCCCWEREWKRDTIAFSRALFSPLHRRRSRQFKPYWEEKSHSIGHHGLTLFFFRLLPATMHWTNSKCLASPFDWEKRTADNESIYIVNLCAVDFISRDGPRPSRWWIAAFPAARTADASPRDNKFEFFIANRPFKSVKKLASQRATVHCAVLLQEENNNNIRERERRGRNKWAVDWPSATSFICH